MGKEKRLSKPWRIYWQARLLDPKRRLGRALCGGKPTIVLVRTRNAGRRKYGPRRRARR